MSTSSTPSQYFTGIAYNSQFYTQPSGISLTVGDARYLKTIVGNHTSNATLTSFINSVNVGGLNSTGTITGPLVNCSSIANSGSYTGNNIYGTAISATSVNNSGFYYGPYVGIDNTIINLGNSAGALNNSPYSTNIGYQAGYNYVGQNSINIGYRAGKTQTGFSSICIGEDTVATGNYSVALGKGSVATGNNNISIGTSLETINLNGSNTTVSQLTNTGNYVGSLLNLISSPTIDTIAIGREAGQFSQYDNAIAIGLTSGNYSQGRDAISIGLETGQFSQ